MEERGRRMQAATLAAPYCHPKKGEAGKKKKKPRRRRSPAGFRQLRRRSWWP
jgi:hypothetical protein